MPIIEISSLTHPGVDVFCMLTETQLRQRMEPGKGVFIAESPNVISRALDAAYEPLALMCERKHISGSAAHIIKRCGDVPVYTGDRELLATLTGYVLTRGVLCAMRRPVLPSMEENCRDTRRIVAIDGVVDTTNIPFGSCSWDRCCFVDTQFLRSVELPCGKGVYGFGVLGSMDMVEWYDWRFEQVWFPYCCHGVD